ncbi:hypothetical protein JKF63_04280 [Porcisia hertigi]|uniref:Uncharacterized protein n=1 Tax=Porcisia hertigi TaxID=2761500 RepID=A0A836L852_9TRYP|nr:hypothetical protein JKF63_04280 [Porcisia hertigi]
MMGYEGRCVLLDDASEWVNIPFVVRELMKQLNDEAKASRAVVHTLQQEQKETNVLLRRVMQKQADLEIDNARNLMSLNQHASQVVHISTEKRHAEQIHHLHKKTERLEDKMQFLSANIERLSQSTLSPPGASDSLHDLKGLVTSLTTKVETTEGILKDYINAQTVVQKPSESLVEAAALAAIRDAQKVLKGQLDAYSAQLRGAEKTMRRLQEATSFQKEESARIRVKCEELSQVVESDRKTSQDRFTSCFHTVEKLEKLCSAQHAELGERMGRAEDMCRGCESRSREESKSLYSELRSFVIDDQTESQHRTNKLAEELRILKEQQRCLAEQLATVGNEVETGSQHAAKQLKDTSVRLVSVETELEQFGLTLVSRRDYQKEQRQTQDSLDEVRKSVADSMAAFQSQAQQLAASVKTMRTEQGEDNDWLHNELGRLSTIVGYTSQQREKQERQVTSLCEIVHNLSVAVEALQKGCGAAAAPSPAPTASPTQRSSPESHSNAEVLAAWETWRSAFAEEVDAKIAAAVSSSSLPHTPSPVLERVSQQLNELTAKVDGGAKYTQAIVSQQMDQMRHTVRDEVTHQLQVHPALREVTPALVEVEAVKRRVAGMELSLQTLSAHADRMRTEAEHVGLSLTDRVLQRVVVAEEAIDDFKRRLLELGEHVMSADQRCNHLVRGAHEMEVQLQEQQRMTLKLGTDLTGALESLLHTEQSLCRHESSTALQLAEVHTWLERWRRGTQATLTLAATTVEPPCSERNGAPSPETSTGDVCERQSGLAAQLAGTVERLSVHVARMEAGTLQAMRADLEALRSECAAATARKIDKDDVSLHTAGAYDTKREKAAYQELRRRIDDEESSRREAEAAFHALEGRLLAVESRVSELSALPKATSPPADKEDSIATPAALGRCVDGLSRCHERLDVVEQQLTRNACCCSSDGGCTSEVKRDVHYQDVHGLQEQLGQLQESIHGFVTSQVRSEMCEAESAMVEAAASVAVLRCQDALRVAADASTAAVDVRAIEERLAVLQAAVEGMQHTFEGDISTLLEGRGRVEELAQTLGATVDGLSALRTAQSELCSELKRAQSSHQGHLQDLSHQFETLVSGTETKVEELRARLRESTVVSVAESCEAGDGAQRPPDFATKAWVEKMLDSIQANYYTKALLEERLENIWSSMIGLLARKEDVSAVHDKLNGLHQLIQEEMQIELQRIEEQLENQLAEKASLANLQDILEHQISSSDADSDDATI